MTTAITIKYLSIMGLVLIMSTGIRAELLDSIAFGDSTSEKKHGLTTDGSKIIQGGLNEPARQLLPREPKNWQGGKVVFTLKVDQKQQNYVTIRLWGSDINRNRLILFCEGKQLGYLHLGDIDILDAGSDEPAYNGRFFYTTSPLPLNITQGKTELKLEVRSIGRIWGYGQTFDKYQYPMEEPSRGIYKMYTHTGGCFNPPAEEKQGKATATPVIRKTPGPEFLEKLKERVNNSIKKMLEPNGLNNQMQIQLVARTYHIPWTIAYNQPNTVKQVTAGLDRLFVEYRKNPQLAVKDPSTFNPEWFGFGPAGDAIKLLYPQLKSNLEEKIKDENGKTIIRRAAWSEMLQAGVEWLRTHRRLYTNQSMIIDMNIYQNNAALLLIDPTHALPEKTTLRYLYEALGLEPWLGSETAQGPSKPMGSQYFQLTAKGLTKELGYVGYYGEVLDWVTQIYDATRPAPNQPGDTGIKAQLEKIIHARAPFRYPMLDAEGNQAMRIEAVIGWRDAHYPGNICYAERTTWDASPLFAPAATLDEKSIGMAQQMLNDNQFFASIAEQMKNNGFRITAGLIHVPEEYELIKKQPPNNYRLPMTPGQPDFVWTDEENGVIAIKYQDEIFYSSLYWRARHAINFLARIHYIKPDYDRIAVVRQETEFVPSGMTYTRQDWTNFGFAKGGLRYPAEIHSLHAGDKMPIAKIPVGIDFKPGQESVYAGKGSFYRLKYGPYLIGMNCTNNKSYTLQIPAEWSNAIMLPQGEKVKAGQNLTVSPCSTIVIRIQEPQQ